MEKENLIFSSKTPKLEILMVFSKNLIVFQFSPSITLWTFLDPSFPVIGKLFCQIWQNLVNDLTEKIVFFNWGIPLHCMPNIFMKN